MRAARTAWARVPWRSERTGAGGATRASASISSATSGAGEREVAVAAVALDGQQPAVDELAQVGAGGRGGDPGLVGEHAGRQRAPVAEREQDPGPRRIGHQRSDLGDVGVALHIIEG